MVPNFCTAFRAVLVTGLYTSPLRTDIWTLSCCCTVWAVGIHKVHCVTVHLTKCTVLQCILGPQCKGELGDSIGAGDFEGSDSVVGKILGVEEQYVFLPSYLASAVVPLAGRAGTMTIITLPDPGLQRDGDWLLNSTRHTDTDRQTRPLQFTRIENANFLPSARFSRRRLVVFTCWKAGTPARSRGKLVVENTTHLSVHLWNFHPS